MTIRSTFVRWAPSRSATNGKVALTVLPLTLKRAEWWHANIQPTIDKEVPVRADRGWRWPLIWATTKFALTQRPIGFAICVTTSTGTEIPCGLVLLVGRYAALDDPNSQSVFLWYLADAPLLALEPVLTLDEIPKMLGTLCLDVAVTHSFSENLDGRTSLHAAPEGGDKLMKWYAKRGMTNLPLTAPKPSRLRSNDGRYFYYTPSSALVASKDLDAFRV
jgi:hypothetical protein